MKRVFISAGEASGDVYGALLARALKRFSPGVVIEGFGGERLRSEGAAVDVSLSRAAVMGWTGVIKNLSFYLRRLSSTRAAWKKSPPNAVVLIDFPGFNLRLARMAHSLGIPVYYYVVPQVWAWGSGRLLKMRKYLTAAFPVLPFEEPLYRSFGIRANFPGHPLREIVPGKFPPRRKSLKRSGLSPSMPLVVMLPGSREEEIRRHLPVFLSAAGKLSLRGGSPQFVVIAAPGKSRLIQSIVSSSKVIAKVTEDGRYLLRSCASMAWTASGTATLELGLMGVPQVVVYRGNWVNWMLARAVVRVSHISLVNLILGREAIPELVQGDFTAGKLIGVSRRLLAGGRSAANAARTAAELNRLLTSRKASREVAAEIANVLQRRS